MARRVWIVSPDDADGRAQHGARGPEGCGTRQQCMSSRNALRASRRVPSLRRADARSREHIRQAHEDVERVQVTSSKSSQRSRRSKAWSSVTRAAASCGGGARDEAGLKDSPHVGWFSRWRRGEYFSRRARSALWRETVARYNFTRVWTMASHAPARARILFLHHKAIHGAAGMAVRDEVRVAIAVQACILILELVGVLPRLGRDRGLSG